MKSLARFAFGLMSALVVGGPTLAQPYLSGSETRQFRDWTVVCNNRNHCAAYAQAVDFGPAWIMVDMPAGPTAQPEITFGSWQAGDETPGDLRIDGRVQPSQEVPPNLGFRRAVQTRAALAAMVAGNQVTIGPPGADEAPLAVSLAGVSASLLWIDERQGRLNTPSALIRRGTRANAQVPRALDVAAPRPGPIVSQSGLPGRASEALIHFARSQPCEEGDTDAADLGLSMEGRLSADTLLWSRTCITGAYNYGARYFLTNGRGGSPRAVHLPQTRQPGDDDLAESDRHVYFNAGYDPETRELSLFYKGRGLGDCGYAATWVWTGAAFALREEAIMNACAGMMPELWPLTWETGPN